MSAKLFPLPLMMLMVLFGCPAESYAAVVFSDTLTEGADTSLAAHAPDAGAGWTLLISNGGGTLKVKAATDDLQIENGGNDGGALYTADLANAYASPNYEISVLQTNGDTGDANNVLAVRIQDADNMYAVLWNEDAGQIYENTAGTWATLGTATAGIADGSIVTLRIEGSVITFLDDGVVLRTVTDGTITAAGKAGVGMGAVILANDDLSGQRLDNVQVTMRRRLISIS